MIRPEETKSIDNAIKFTGYEVQKPFLKWVGGKTQIINDIILKLSNEINNCHKLFMGVGSVLLAVLFLSFIVKGSNSNPFILHDFLFIFSVPFFGGDLIRFNDLQGTSLMD